MFTHFEKKTETEPLSLRGDMKTPSKHPLFTIQ